jgi:protein SCO1/2
MAGTLAGLVAVVLAVVGYVVWARPGDGPTATPGGDTYGAAPTYTLTDQHGRSVSSAALRGKIQVVSFLFPYCTTYCPVIARTLAQTEQLIEHAGLRHEVAFVVFNVDPAGAGPAQLSAFLSQELIDPDDPAWHYLTGSPAAVRRVVRSGFHVFYQKESLAQVEKDEASERAAGDYTAQPTEPNPLADRAHVDYDVVHNDVIEIVDAQGIIRNVLTGGSAATPRQILAAVQDARR